MAVLVPPVFLKELTLCKMLNHSFPFALVMPQAVTRQKIQMPKVEISFIKAGPASKKIPIY